MGRFEGRVALVTGAARGQGRAVAVRLAQEGADVIALDICAPVDGLNYPPSTREDLAETERHVKASGRRIVARVGDVRSLEQVQSAVDDGIEELGRLDIIVANAGISAWGRVWELSPEQWHTMIDTNLTGVWHTLRAGIPPIIAGERGGSIVITSSVSGLKALPAQSHYVAAKHGLVGLAKAAAIELAEFGIRVNTVHPWGVDTPMGHDDTIYTLMAQHPDYAKSFGSVLPIQLATPDEIADAVLFLAGDESRCVTGVQLPVDMGATTV
jgi:SDR family mycofactocin-dependent oxidoreductase